MIDETPPDPAAIRARHRRFWLFFCDQSGVRDDIPLFDEREGRVAVVEKGRQGRPYLARSAAMEALVLAETAKLVADHAAGGTRYDGLIYCLCRPADEGTEPLFLGHVATTGPDGALHPELAGIHASAGHPFVGWGYAPGTHLGGLSAAVLGDRDTARGDHVRRRRYAAWAETLFAAPWDRRVLRAPVRFWARAWERAQRGPWIEFGPTGVRSLVSQLLAVSNAVFPDVLNDRGGV